MSAPHNDLPPEAFGVELDPLPPWSRDDAATQADRVIHEFETEDRVTDSQRARDTAYVVGLLAPLPPDAEALVEACEARAAKAGAAVERLSNAAIAWSNLFAPRGPQTPTNRKLHAALLRVIALYGQTPIREDIPALCALLRTQQREIALVKRCLAESQEQIAEMVVEGFELKAAHGREREGLEGDKAQLAADLAKAKAEAERIKAAGMREIEVALFAASRADRERDEAIAKVERMKPVVEALLLADRQELPQGLADTVRLYVDGGAA